MDGGGAPAVDAAGHIWVSTGNGSVYSACFPYDDSDSVLELSSSLHLLQYFAPPTGPATMPMISTCRPFRHPERRRGGAGRQVPDRLPARRLPPRGYRRTTGQLATGCAEDIDGGVAVVGTTVYLPCLAGVLALSASDFPTLSPPVVAVGDRRRSSHRGRRPGVDHRPERRAVRPGPGHRCGGPGRRRWGCRPTAADPGGGRRSCVGALGSAGGGLCRHRADQPDHCSSHRLDDHRPPRRGDSTGHHLRTERRGPGRHVVLSVVAAAVVVGGVVMFRRRRRTGAFGDGGGPAPGPSGTG